LQNASRDSDACPSRPEQVREKFLSQGNAGAAESVLTHQQPSRQSLFNFIHPIGRVYRNSPYKVIDRINSVNAMLLNAQGSRRLLISPKCNHLINALDCLTYKEGSNIPDKRSGLDHISDALGYLIMGVFPIITSTVSIHTVLL
jgi:hypothetical protein